jgi:hypothetical protein
MDKKYFLHMVSADLGIFAFYGMFFFLLLMLTMWAMKIRSPQNYFIAGILFVFYHLLVPLDFKFNFIPYLPDSDIYWLLFESDIPPPDMSSSLVGFYSITRILRVLLMYNIIAYVSFQIYLYFVSIFIFLKSWELLYKHHSHNTFRQFFLGLALLLPSSILYTLVPLRECFTSFAFAVSLYFLTLMFKKSSIINSGFLAGLFLVLFTRVQVAFYFILTFLGLKVVIDKNIMRKVAVSVLGIGLFIGLVIYTNYQIDPVKLQWARNYRVNNYTPSYGLVSWKTYGDILASTPDLAAQFLLSPFPILHDFDPMQFKLATLDALFVLALLIVLLINIKHVIKNNLYWFLLILFYLILFGIYEFGVLGAVRHRLPMTILIIAIVADRLTHLLSKKTKA